MIDYYSFRQNESTLTRRGLRGETGYVYLSNRLATISHGPTDFLVSLMNMIATLEV